MERIGLLLSLAFLDHLAKEFFLAGLIEPLPSFTGVNPF